MNSTEAFEQLNRERKALDGLQQRLAGAVNEHDATLLKLSSAKLSLEDSEVADIVGQTDTATKFRKIVSQLEAQCEATAKEASLLRKAIERQQENIRQADLAYTESVREFLENKFASEITAFADAMAAAARLQKPLRDTVAMMVSRGVNPRARDLAFTWADVAFTAEYPSAVTPVGVAKGPVILTRKLGWWLDQLACLGYDVEPGRQDEFALVDTNQVGWDIEIQSAFAAGEAAKEKALAPKLGAASRIAATANALLQRIGLAQ